MMWKIMRTQKFMCQYVMKSTKSRTTDNNNKKDATTIKASTTKGKGPPQNLRTLATYIWSNDNLRSSLPWLFSLVPRSITTTPPISFNGCLPLQYSFRSDIEDEYKM
jgi:hypothetical protein